MKKSIPEDSHVYIFGRTKVETTHLSKIYFPEDHISKGDVIEYYISMSKYLLPYLKGRPESLLRHPNGIHGQGFFQKDAAGIIPSYAGSKVIYSESSRKDVEYILCNNAATLTYLNNLGCIELNPWHSTADRPDAPDYLVIDIDPSSGNTFEDVIEAAIAVKETLQRAGASSFCKTSGATGMHVYVPTHRKYSYEQAKDFAHVVCMIVADQMKSTTTLERNLEKRSSKKIYMDYLQNSRGQTIACAYSLRPRKGATVSAPLQWKEVRKGLDPADFNIHSIGKRVAKHGDLFAGVLGKGINLNDCLKKLGA